MELPLLAGLSVVGAFIAAGISIATLVRVEDLHRELRYGRAMGRQKSGVLRGRGKVLRLYDDQPPRR